ncbi:MAG: nucleoside hydrolase [Eubacteriales bacterium]|nr:nucleoside hydrolase [Eubacteriales bacterium]
MENVREQRQSTKKHVIIDCDPGIDDSLAIMLALSMEELWVEGITIVCGNSPVEMGFGNAKKVLKQMDRLDIPVFQGEAQPLKREYVNALDTHGEDGLGESFLPEVPGYGQSLDAVSFMSERIRSLSEKGNGCSVIALGPMTNLARLIQRDGEAFSMIDELVSMGGSFRNHGNCSPVAEYNYWADPDAAALVYDTAYRTGREIAMVGLDVTRRIVLTPDLLEYMKRLKPETGRFVQAITKFYYDFHWKWEHLIGCVINDPLAVAYFADRSLCGGIRAYTAVETGGISMGQTVVDSMSFYKKRPNALVLTQVDVRGFFRLFLSRILGIPEEELDLTDQLVRDPAQSTEGTGGRDII